MMIIIYYILCAHIGMGLGRSVCNQARMQPKKLEHIWMHIQVIS